MTDADPRVQIESSLVETVHLPVRSIQKSTKLEKRRTLEIMVIVEVKKVNTKTVLGKDYHFYLIMHHVQMK